MTGTFSRWPQSLSCSMAAARKVSHAASKAVPPRDWTKCASLAAVVVLPVPLTPTMETTVSPSGSSAKLGLIGAQAVLHLRLRDLKDIRPGAALGLVGLLDCAENLAGHGHAQVGSNQRGFQFLERCGVSLGEPVTMRLISCVSLLCVFCRPALNFANNPMGCGA